MVVSWPARITDTGGVRSQFTHLIDILPTVLDIAGIPAPVAVDGIDQKPLDGVSIASTFDSADARPVRQRQYFEIIGNRAIYDQGWIACAQHTLPWRQDLAPGNWDNDRWELYHLDEDYSEGTDLAGTHPGKLTELKEIFERECTAYGVYPFDDRGAARISVPKPPPGGADPNRTHFTYYPGTFRLPETAAPNTKNRSHVIEVTITEPGDGILLALGGSSAGFALYVRNGKPVYHYNYFGRERTIIESSSALPAGPSTVRFEFVYDGGGLGQGGDGILLIDDTETGRQRIPNTVAGRFGIDTFNVGRDAGSPVSPDYTMPYPFTGTIGRVDIIIAAAGVSTDEARLRAMFDAGKNY